MGGKSCALVDQSEVRAVALTKQILQVLLQSWSRRSGEVRLNLQVSHGQQDLIVLQQSGEKTHRFV